MLRDLRRRLMRLRRAETVDRIDHGRADQLLALGRGHHQFLVAVGDRARFQQRGRHVRLLQHEQRVVTIDARDDVEQRVLIVAHKAFGVMRRELQAARLQPFAEHAGEQQAVFEIDVVLRNENGMALETVAERFRLAVVVPLFQKLVRHRVVMDREQEIGAELVGARHAHIHAPDARAVRDHQHGLGKAGVEQGLINHFGEPPVEIEFVGAARAFGAGRFGGVADIEHDAEVRPGASSGGFRGSYRAVRRRQRRTTARIRRPQAKL